ncbi:hypothetical protein [Paenibacillus sp. 1A_MP2]|uniref:hypothetical protein n=1 Tax=Paenibacillus sp. 1A_MP2 TaxID=3457495 RepID=UPI003FCCEC03
MKFHIDNRNWLREPEEPKRTYYFELRDGRRGESDTALQLFDLLANQYYSDTDDRITQIMMLGAMCKDIAVSDFAIRGLRAKVYSGVGLFYDNGQPVYADEMKETQAVKFINDKVSVLDFWNEWTCIATMIKSGYLSLYEKAHLVSSEERDTGYEDLTYFEKILGEENTESFNGYRKVSPNIFDQEPTWIPNYIKVLERTNEAEHS